MSLDGLRSMVMRKLQFLLSGFAVGSYKYDEFVERFPVGVNKGTIPKSKKPCKLLTRLLCARDWNRTSTPVKAADFESAASTNSATWAGDQRAAMLQHSAQLNRPGF